MRALLIPLALIPLACAPAPPADPPPLVVERTTRVVVVHDEISDAGTWGRAPPLDSGDQHPDARAPDASRPDAGVPDAALRPRPDAAGVDAAGPCGAYPPAEVLRGSATLESDRDVTDLAGVRCITGNLIIDRPAGLESVAGIAVEVVAGAVTIRAPESMREIRLPALRSAHTVDIRGFAVRLDLPALTTVVADLVIASCPRLTSVSIPLLASARNISFNGASALSPCVAEALCDQVPSVPCAATDMLDPCDPTPCMGYVCGISCEADAGWVCH